MGAGTTGTTGHGARSLPVSQSLTALRYQDVRDQRLVAPFSDQ